MILQRQLSIKAQNMGPNYFQQCKVIFLYYVFMFYFTNTSTLRKYNLPVDDELLQSARCHFIRLTQRTMATVHRESAKIEGILLSLKCFRTTTVSSDD